jgi:predicted CoA-substrate-specific enzyme activase
MAQSGNLQLGIDIGSTTVKAVVLGENDQILWKKYERHNARQPELVLEFLKLIEEKYPNFQSDVYVTGSGGRTIAPLLNGHYIQEVNAVTYAVEKLYPDAGSVIELGGQDAKVIIWKVDDNGRKSTLTFMNDKCAGGTGATIDKIFGKIGLPIEQASVVSAEGKTIHHIAAKCGVFAETDVVGLIKAGIDREEIFVSLCTAIVKQNLEVLVRGNVLRDKVVLLGGPHTYISAFAQLWRKFIPKTWEIHGWQPSQGSLEQLIFVPDDAQFFAAMGAVFFGRESETLFKATHTTSEPSHRYNGTSKLEEFIHRGRAERIAEYGAVRDGLIKCEQELSEFKEKYTIPVFVPPVIGKGNAVNGYIGIDGGSTSSKLVIIDENGVLLYKDYILSKGNPIIDVREMFGRIGAWVKENGCILNVKGTGVTGYASSILYEAFSLDRSVVETVAHMKSAVAFYGDVDIICDIGGQDIKVMFMKHGRVVDFNLNTQCSAGNGYFLQNMAEQFGIPIEKYADYAFTAQKAPAFNYGCAVFMEQDKVHFQQLGFSKEEIMAGLALVLPLNIWNYVVQETNIARLGKTILLQGGTQKNLAAVKSQVDFIKSRVPDAVVHVHKYADISGAIGAALEIREQQKESVSRFIGIENASKLEFESVNNETTRCSFCTNRCPRTFIDIQTTLDKKIRFISGYGCERGMFDNVKDMKSRESEKVKLREKYPNLIDLSAKIVFDTYSVELLPESRIALEWPHYLHHKDYPKDPLTRTTSFQRSSNEAAAYRETLTIGMPKLLNMYMYAPFFNGYFRALGVNDVIYSDYTSANLWNEGNKWGAIDPCFPAKVAPAHIYNLFGKKGITDICFPIITHLQSIVGNTLGNNACVIQMGTPEVVHAVFTKDRDYFKEKSIRYLKPFVKMDRPRETAGLMYDYFKDLLRITQDENTWAVVQGFKAMQEYLDTMQCAGAKVLNQLVETDSVGILMLGHPYHHDPGLNHGIPDEFQMRGFPVFPIESLPTDPTFLSTLFTTQEMAEIFSIKDVWIRNFNRNTNLKIWAAKFAAHHPNLAVVDLSSFKCGHDAPTYSYISNILDSSETPHFLFHDIDQNKPRAAFTIRIQTIEYFLRIEERRLREKVKGYTK